LETGSGFYENDVNDNFNKKEPPTIVQVFTIKDIAVVDYNDHGYKNLLIIGHNHKISPQLGRMNAMHGVILQDDGKV